jgi:protein TonB
MPGEGGKPPATEFDMLRSGRGFGRWGGAFCVALLVHLGGALGLVAWARIPPYTPLPPAVAIIDLDPAAPAAPPSEKAAGPVRTLARPSPPPDLEKLDVPRLAEAKDPPVAVPVRPQLRAKRPDKKRPPDRHQRLPEVPDHTRREDETTAPKHIDAPSSANIKAPAPGTSSLPDSALPTWQQRLVAHLERYKRYPADAQSRHQEGTPTVRFVLDRRGNVLSARLEASSGVPALDAEAVNLLHRASPVPPPPPELPGDRIELVIPVVFFIR